MEKYDLTACLDLLPEPAQEMLKCLLEKSPMTLADVLKGKEKNILFENVSFFRMISAPKMGILCQYSKGDEYVDFSSPVVRDLVQNYFLVKEHSQTPNIY